MDRVLVRLSPIRYDKNSLLLNVIVYFGFTTKFKFNRFIFIHDIFFSN